MQCKYTKMNEQEILSIIRNVLEFFYVPMYGEFLSILHEKFQVASIYDTNV